MSHGVVGSSLSLVSAEVCSFLSLEVCPSHFLYTFNTWKGGHTAKTEVLEMRFTAYFWAKCSHYQWHFLYLDFSVLKRRVTISFLIN